MTAGYADIIFFAVVAIYLGLKLFSILGKKNDNDTNLEARANTINIPGMPKAAEAVDAAAAMQARQVPPVEKNKLENFKFASDTAKSGMKEVIEKDSNFALEDFIEGAKMAVEMVLKAYSDGDKAMLKELLSDELYGNMSAQLDSQLQQGLVATKSLIAIEDVEIASATVAASRVKIGLRFLTEQINVTKDSNDSVVEGDPKAIITVEDEWEFERNIRSSNPNWTIISI